MYKNYQCWHSLKEKLDSKDSYPSFKEKEIWWCHLGCNVGNEENGKGNVYSRPVLVIKKFNKRIFWGLPLTTQVKENPYYYQIMFRHKDQCVMLSQLRLWDSKRLTSKMGALTEEQFQAVKVRIGEMLV